MSSAHAVTETHTGTIHALIKENGWGGSKSPPQRRAIPKSKRAARCQAARHNCLTKPQ
jgi:hypothetical protein